MEPTVVSRDESEAPPKPNSPGPGQSVAATSRSPNEALPKEPAEPVQEEPPLFDGPCPPGMALVDGGEVTRAQRKRWQKHFYEDRDGSVPEKIAPFCLDIHEATEADFLRCGQACQENFARWAPSCTKDKHCATVPLTGLYSRENYLAFCRLLGKRHVSMSEWLWAAGGGAEDRKYPWGNARPTVKHLNACDFSCARVLQADCGSSKCKWKEFADVRGDDGYADEAPVGSFLAGAGRWGHLDLAGNVYEMVLREDGKHFWCGGAFAALQSVSLHHSETCDAGVAGKTDGLRCARDVEPIRRP